MRSVVLGAIALATLSWLLLQSFVWLERSWRPSDSELLRLARLALSAGRYDEAVEFASGVLEGSPDSTAALLVAGEASTKLERWDQALDFYQQVSAVGGVEALVALGAQGDLLRREGRLREAEETFRRVLEYDPDSALAHHRLAFLLGVQGRRWESLPHLFALLRNRQFDLETLLHLGNTERLIESPVALRAAVVTHASDPLALLGLARLAMRDHDHSQAEKWLRKIVAQHPEQPEAQVRLGELILQSMPERTFVEWEQQLPEVVDSHPEVWVLRGEMAQIQRQSRVAARCFWEALRRDPDHRSALYQLGQLLASSQLDEPSQLLLERHQKLTELLQALDRIYGQRDSTDAMRTAAELTESLGRIWESWGWYELIARSIPDAEWARIERDRLRAKLDADIPPRQLVRLEPAHLVDLADYPLPARQDRAPLAVRTTPRLTRDPSQGQLRWVDMAAESGVEFTYFESPDSTTEGRRMYEFAGGGVAVLDLDGDGWPDLYFAQGCPWPPDSEQETYRNRLFRNLGNGRFMDITEWAGVGDIGFGQGVTVGDFNDDGFPDLYVANIGLNRLYLNNGDGTFQDATETCGITRRQWTTSCLMADLNGNGFPDLYDVNYLSGKELFTRLCEWKGGRWRICGPATFEPEQDEVWVNSGDGLVHNQTATSGVALPGGNGLGIVAANLDGSGLLSLFVANDQTANYFLVNQSIRGSSEVRFQDQALSLGLAFDRDGNSQACMGVAAGDAAGNGLLDLFVTNFYEESNTLYLQRPGLFFSDETRPARLRDPSYRMLGFGAQFLDGDLNGHLDLVLTNGHLDDFTYLDQPYAMPPQYFRNTGKGVFSEVPATELGFYFQGSYLGRALARIDWNRDGRDDFVVTHLDAPVALITNQTNSPGNFLAIHLRGVESSRDALGTTVRLRAGDRLWTQQLTAGDGYLASNHRRLTFGLGSSQSVDELRIRWPSGLEQTFGEIAANRELIAVEGHPELVYLAPAN